VLVFLVGGNDHAGMSSKLPRDAFLFGGDDDLRGGAGRDLIVGGDGDDYLEGRRGREVLIGGTGLTRSRGARTTTS
jgi:Ca2+-binding RTX toxin-like protein